MMNRLGHSLSRSSAKTCRTFEVESTLSTQLGASNVMRLKEGKQKHSHGGSSCSIATSRVAGMMTG